MPTATNTSRPSDVPRFVDRIVRPLTHVLNPLILRIAGGRWFPMFSLLHHRGYRTGRMYATPITAMPGGGGGWFWLALTFGESAGWVRNIIDAKECVIRYRGVDYQLVEPVMLDGAAVRSELPPVMRYGMPLIGVNKVFRLRIVSKDV